MKRLAIAITASVIMLAGCQSDILQVEEMKKGEAPGANLKSAGLTCVNVREQKDFLLAMDVEIDFSDLEALFEILVAEFYPPQEGLLLYFDMNNSTVTGMGASFGNIFEDYFEGMEAASIVAYQHQRGDGSTFIRLFHLFKSDEGSFLTLDEAVQTPLNRHMVSRINNKLEIVAGTGIFEDVTGSIINNGSVQHIYLSEYEMIVPVSLEANLHGRICY